jgi:hypothetical protein
VGWPPATFTHNETFGGPYVFAVSTTRGTFSTRS